MSSNQRAEKDHINSGEKCQSFYQLEKANSQFTLNGSPVKILLIVSMGFGVRVQQV